MRFLFFFLFTIISVNAFETSRVRMEPKVDQFTSKRWIQLTQPPADDATILAIFTLKHDAEKLKSFESNLLEISTPSNAKYGQWLTKQEAIDFLAPTDERVKIVTDFISGFGISDFKISGFKDMVKVKLPIKIAEEMFQTEFASFRSALFSNIVINRITKPYSLPADVASVVSLVDNILRFPSIRKSNTQNGLTSGSDPEFSSCGTPCKDMTTPDVLQSRYGYSPLTTAANGNSVSVTEFQFQYYDNVDLEAFSDACGVEVDVDTTIGGNKDYICTKIGGCVEALLDIEYIGAVSSPIPLTVIYQQDYSLLDWVDSVINMDKPPLVHSVSYGNDEVQQTSSEYMDSCNTQFQIAGSLGLSILFASGDQGVWGRSGPGKTFHPDFPAGSPYITAVGGTNFQTKSKIGNETTWNCAGGGFSDQFPRPSWQDSQVNNYLKTAPLPSTSLFNENGRGYPDISALAGQTNPYCVAVKGGDFMGVAGTSASCPVIGGLIGQLNDLRLKAGKPSLGWLNPFLYSADAAKCFYDVNDGSKNNCNPGTEGFTAENGWDPATGLGTPNFKCLASLVIV